MVVVGVFIHKIQISVSSLGEEHYIILYGIYFKKTSLNLNGFKYIYI